jgi:basic membrane protein A
MSGFDLDRRKVLEGVGALGASALLQATLPIRLARAGELVAGFVYIGPRLDWGWNESHAVAALALEGVPHAGVVQADYLPESTNYGSGKASARPTQRQRSASSSPASGSMPGTTPWP